MTYIKAGFKGSYFYLGWPSWSHQSRRLHRGRAAERDQGQPEEQEQDRGLVRLQGHVRALHDRKGRLTSFWRLRGS